MAITNHGDPVTALPEKRNACGLSPNRIAQFSRNVAMLEAQVMRLAAELPFEAEPWGFGEGLLRLAQSDE